MEKQTMGRPEAICILAVMARRPGISEAEVIALRVGVIALCKRHFDYARNRARKYEKMRDAETTAPEKKEGGVAV